MILILSSPQDFSTDNVCDWLEYYNATYVRIEPKQIFKDFRGLLLESNNNRWKFNQPMNIPFLPSEINVVWYRKWHYLDEINIPDLFDLNQNYLVHTNLKNELKDINSFWMSFFKNSFWLDKPSAIHFNKLEQLTLASEVGLNVPSTLITGNKEELFSFFNKYKSIITKPIKQSLSITLNNEKFTSYTSTIDADFISELNDFFAPALVQEMIHKEIELRIFYLDEKIYSMAIFSQNDEKTKIDFRNYNLQKGNRTVPFTLPTKIENAIISFMKKAKLITGSIDIIKSIDNKYYFLEVNPVGQYGMVSTPCQYDLDKVIANFLIKKLREKTF